MKPEQIWERRQSAATMEAVMLLASFVGGVTTIVVFLGYGWVPGLTMFLLSLIAFALSRMFDLLSDLIFAIRRDEQSGPVKDKDPA